MDIFANNSNKTLTAKEKDMTHLIVQTGLGNPQAFELGSPGRWAQGDTDVEALGKLVKKYQGEFGLKVTILEHGTPLPKEDPQPFFQVSDFIYYEAYGSGNLIKVGIAGNCSDNSLAYANFQHQSLKKVIPFKFTEKGSPAITFFKRSRGNQVGLDFDDVLLLTVIIDVSESSFENRQVALDLLKKQGYEKGFQRLL